MNLSDLSKQGWHRTAIAGALLGGLFAGALCWMLSATTPWLAALLGFVVGASLFALLITLVGSVNVKLNNILRRVNESENELQSMINVRPLVDDILLQYGGWAMDAHLAETIARLLLQKRPQFVVECGSGSSTLLMASCLKRMNGHQRLVALDHEPKYASITRDMLEQQDLDDWAEVRTVPLEPWKIKGQELPWYGLDLETLPDQSIDLLIVDGPPGMGSTAARYPAVPVLQQHLSDECIIVLDDGDRADEHEAAHRWAEDLNADLEYAGGAKGTWILRRKKKRPVLLGRVKLKRKLQVHPQ